MTRTLSLFISDLLEYHGALVDVSDGEQLEALLPEALSATLSIPEHARFRFSLTRPDAVQEKAQETVDDAIWVSYDSDLFKAFSGLLEDRGRYVTAHLSPPTVKIEKLSGKIADRISFNNAVFRVAGHEVTAVSYLVTYAKYTAISDEKREGLIVSAINERNGSTVRLRRDVAQSLEGLIETAPPEKEGAREEADGGLGLNKVLQAAHRGMVAMTREMLQDFVKSLERRLNRDIQRVDDYYHALTEEAKRLIEKKGAAAHEGAKEIEEKRKEKILAIEQELRWKVNDLVSKYALRVRIEPVSFIRVQSKVPLFWLKIQRRKGTRRFPLAYHPILRTLEDLPCESCYYPRKPYSVCDDRLHIVCSRCFEGCPRCGRDYCLRCHPKECPKCLKRPPAK